MSGRIVRVKGWAGSGSAGGLKRLRGGVLSLSEKRDAPFCQRYVCLKYISLRAKSHSVIFQNIRKLKVKTRWELCIVVRGLKP